MNKKVISQLFVALSLATVGLSAQASLISQAQLSVNLQEKIFTSPAATPVTAGIELDSTVLSPTGAHSGFTGAISIDVSDTAQTIRLFVTQTFSSGIADFLYIHALMNSLLLPGTISNVSIVSDTLLANPGASGLSRSLSFTGNSIALNYDDPSCCANIQSGGEIILAYETVPEPATLALLGAGLVGMGARRRRSKT